MISRVARKGIREAGRRSRQKTRSKRYNDQSSDQSQPSTTKPEEFSSVQDLLVAVKETNQSIRSFRIEAQGKSSVDYKEEAHAFSATGVYAPSSDEELEKAYMLFERKTTDEEFYQEDILTGESFYYRKGSDEDWSLDPSIETYNIDPSYLSLLDIVYQLEGDLELEDSGDWYHLRLSNQNADLINLFHDELNMDFDNYNYDEIEKTFDVYIDKDSLYLTDFYLSLNYKGEDGLINMDFDANYSEWNQVDEDYFQVPENWAITLDNTNS